MQQGAALAKFSEIYYRGKTPVATASYTEITPCLSYGL